MTSIIKPKLQFVTGKIGLKTEKAVSKTSHV